MPFFNPHAGRGAMKGGSRSAMALIFVILLLIPDNSLSFVVPKHQFQCIKYASNKSPYPNLRPASLALSHSPVQEEDASQELVEMSPPTEFKDGHPDLIDAISKFSPNTEVDASRIFHGRGGLFAGAEHLTLDFYPPVFLLTSFQEISEDELGAYEKALKNLWDKTYTAANCDESIDDQDIMNNNSPQFTWVYQCRAERGNTMTKLMAGEIPDPHIVTEDNGKNKFLVHLLKGQNHGLFLDMAAGRKWLQNKCEEGEVVSVLNLFAYTCAFSIAALNGGADTVVNVDMSRGALKTGQRSHEINGLVEAGGAKFLAHDIFKTWGKMKKLGPYDCVVVDPPSYQKGSFVASKDYVKVIRRLPSLLTEEGYALLCLNAPELGTEFLYQQVIESAPEMCYIERLENPLTFASAFPERALKVLVFQYKPMGTE